jgi:uncharacterized protein
VSQAVLRFVRQGRVWGATPVLVARDDPEAVVLVIPPGTVEQVADPRGVPREWRLRASAVREPHVLVHRPGEWHTAYSFWRDDGRRWYVNVEEPLRRSTCGFETRDLFLDVWVEPDGRWELLDEDELAEALERGFVSAEEARLAKAEAERAIRRLERGEWPFSESWDAYRPGADSPVPALPEGWDEL